MNPPDPLDRPLFRVTTQVAPLGPETRAFLETVHPPPPVCYTPTTEAGRRELCAWYDRMDAAGRSTGD